MPRPLLPARSAHEPDPLPYLSDPRPTNIHTLLKNAFTESRAARIIIFVHYSKSSDKVSVLMPKVFRATGSGGNYYILFSRPGNGMRTSDYFLKPPAGKKVIIKVSFFIRVVAACCCCCCFCCFIKHFYKRTR